MAVALTDISEVSAIVHWRRKNCAVGSGKRWWEGVDQEELANEISTISSFHVRVRLSPSNGQLLDENRVSSSNSRPTSREGGQQQEEQETGSGALISPSSLPPPVYDEQFGDHHAEFSACATRLKGLRPGTTYSISVRASTGMLWGGWSVVREFTTQIPVSVSVRCVGETFANVAWHRPPNNGKKKSLASSSPQERRKSSTSASKSSSGKKRKGSSVGRSDNPDDGIQDASLQHLRDEANRNNNQTVVAKVTDGDDNDDAVSPPRVSSAQATPERNEQQQPDDEFAAILGEPQGWEMSFKTLGASSLKHTVHVKSAATLAQCVGSLKANTPYTICVRPTYVESGLGAGGSGGGSSSSASSTSTPWSSPAYFVTLPPLCVEVGKVGETFVQVSWERSKQQTITTKLKQKHQEQLRILDGQLRELEEKRGSILVSMSQLPKSQQRHLQQLQEQEQEEEDKEKKQQQQQQNNKTEGGEDEEEAAIGLDELQDGGAASASNQGEGDSPPKKPKAASPPIEDDDKEESTPLPQRESGGQTSTTEEGETEEAQSVSSFSSASTTTTRAHKLQQELKKVEAAIKAMENRITQSHSLSKHQIHELEHTALYPKGDDVRYEVLVKQGGNSSGNGGGGNSAFSNNNANNPNSEWLADDSFPLFIRKRLGRGESSYRIEKMTPKTTYQVTVRALHVPQFGHGILSAAEQRAILKDTERTDVGDVDDENNKTPWGAWADRQAFVTLKPISISTRGVGSECFAVEWDTGVSSGGTGAGANSSSTSPTAAPVVATSGGTSTRTAISRFSIQLACEITGPRPFRRDLTVVDATAKGNVIGELVPNAVYVVKVQVCYEEDKWGVWSNEIRFQTLPKILGKLQLTSERVLEFLAWRDQSAAQQQQQQQAKQKQSTDTHDTDPESPQQPQIANLVRWDPEMTEHQLSINKVACEDTFQLEKGSSTQLTLDTLSVDTEYTISVRDKVEDYWQEYRPILVTETLPYAPSRPTLLERKGPNVAIAWEHRKNLSHNRQYLYMVEIALVDDPRKMQMKNGGGGQQQNLSSSTSTIGPFHTLGFTTAQEFRLELPYPIHLCGFRVKVCKTNQTIDGIPQPITVPPSDDNNQSSPASQRGGGGGRVVTVDNPHMYVWSECSPVAHFKTPSVPDHPSGLHVTHLTHSSAVLHWRKPSNHSEHTNIVYRVYMNNSYADKFVCIGQTNENSMDLQDLLPNCHYRASVIAESTMGTSVQNNTLHFSTHILPSTPSLGGSSGSASSPAMMMMSGGSGTKKKNNNSSMESIYGGGVNAKPMTSTLPPRRIIKAPREFMKAQSKKSKAAAPRLEEVGDGLFDDRATTVFTAKSPLRNRARSPDVVNAEKSSPLLQQSVMRSQSALAMAPTGGTKLQGGGGGGKAPPRDLPPL